MLFLSAVARLAAGAVGSIDGGWSAHTPAALFLADGPWPTNDDLSKWLVCAAAVALIVERIVALFRGFGGKDGVAADSFEKHKAEIWEVVNGLRRAISDLSAKLSSLDGKIDTSNALREASKDRLNEIAREVGETRREFHLLNGSVRQFIEDQKQ